MKTLRALRAFAVNFLPASHARGIDFELADGACARVFNERNTRAMAAAGASIHGYEVNTTYC